MFGIKKNKMAVDIVWNMASMAIVSICGFLYNTIIAIFYTTSVLGVFNQVYAYYIVISQIAVFGIHFSVLRHTPLCTEDSDECRSMIGSALVSTFIISVLVIGVSYGLLFILIPVTNMDVFVSLRYALPALLFFSLNKVLLNYINGLRKMKMFAVYQALRFIFISLGLFIMALSKMDGGKLPYILVMAEVSLFIFMILNLIINESIKITISRDWISKHLKFGSKIFLGNLVVDLNTRVDVIVLGIFVADSIVGIYSFALMFAEGLYQLLVVFRRNINPLIAKYNADGASDSLLKLKKDTFSRLYKFIPFVSVAVVIAYYLLCTILGRMEYITAISSLVILLIGITITSGFIVFGNILNQTGYPHKETVINVFTVVGNVVFNFILIPPFGIIGAAVATALSYVVYAIVLNRIAGKTIEFYLIGKKQTKSVV